METTPLGDSGIIISRVGFGGCPLGGHGWGTDGSDQQGMQAVRRALELGVDFYDTADVYGLGRSEQLLSQALGNHRHKITIATKFGVRWDAEGRTKNDISPKYLTVAIEASLKRLRLDCIPLYYVHWPDSQTPVEEVIGALDLCRCAGKISAMGVSNFSAAQLKRACQIAPIAALQLQYSLVDRQKAASACSTAKQLGVPLITWGSLAQGLLTGKYSSESIFGTDDRRHRYENFSNVKLLENMKTVKQLQEISTRLKKTPAQIALRWLLDSDNVGAVLFGAKRTSQVEDNVGALDWRLSTEDYQLLEASQIRQTERAA